MNTLTEYLIEAMSIQQKKEVKDVQKSLNGTYENAIDELNEMLKDPKGRGAILACFGGENANLKLKIKRGNLEVLSLTPTQNEIDFGKSVDFGLSIKPEFIPNYFNNVVKIKMPLITYNGSFIIDGHHRWSQLFAFNPTAKIEVLNITGNVSPLAFLKIVQGSIAASLLDNDPNKENVQLPIAEVKPGLNILKMNDNELKSNVEKRITDKAVEELIAINNDLTNKEECVEYIATNCGILRDNNKPIGGAPTRPYMPQTDRVEPRPSDDISPELKERIINTIRLK